MNLGASENCQEAWSLTFLIIKIFVENLSLNVMSKKHETPPATSRQNEWYSRSSRKKSHTEDYSHEFQLRRVAGWILPEQ